MRPSISLANTEWIIVNSHYIIQRYISLTNTNTGNFSSCTFWSYLGREDDRPPTCIDIIRESVESLCRDGADMPMLPYIRKACNRPNVAFVSLFIRVLCIDIIIALLFVWLPCRRMSPVLIQGGEREWMGCRYGTEVAHDRTELQRGECTCTSKKDNVQYIMYCYTSTQKHIRYTSIKTLMIESRKWMLNS